MSPTTQHERDADYGHRRLEMLLFLAVSAAGVFAFGQGMRGLFQPGAGFDLSWLAVAGGAFWVLYAQMCRVQATWPRRPGATRRRRLPPRRRTTK